MQIKKYTTKPLPSALLKYEGQERKKNAEILVSIKGNKMSFCI